MSAVRFRLLLLAVFSLAFVDRSPSSVTAAPEPTPTPNPKAPSSIAMAKLPVRFEANVGQSQADARFIARQGGSALLLGDEGTTLSVRTSAPEPRDRHHSKRLQQHEKRTPTTFAKLKMSVANGRVVQPQAGDELVTKTNYLIGKDSSKWHTNISTYGKITYPNVLDGVDLVYHGEKGALEYDFIVAPNTNVDTVAMNVEGAASMSITPKGELAIHTATGDLIQPPPVVFQYDEHGVKQTRISSYRIVDKNRVGFEVASYDHAKQLVIDPVLAFATYFGGGQSEEGVGVAGDSAGNTYITGNTFSDATTFPETVNAYQKQIDNGNTNDCNGACGDAFVAKLDSLGQNLVYATYIGGGDEDEAYGIAVSPTTNEAFITGYTGSSDFPTTGLAGSFGTQNGSGNDTFVVRLSASGSSVGYSKLIFGGFPEIANDAGYAIAVDGAGRAYVTGEITVNNIDAIEVPPGSSGGGGSVPAGGPQGQIGFNSTLFVARLLADGSDLDGNPFGTGGNGSDVGQGIALDAVGNAYITGYTTSSNFPTVAAPASLVCNANSDNADAVVIKVGAFAPLNGNAQTAALWAVCVGGNSSDFGYGIASTAAGSVALVGETSSSNFPLLAAPGSTIFQDEQDGNSDAFITKLDTNGNPVFSTYFGGNQFESAQSVAFDAGDALWITGYTGSTVNFPITPSAPQKTMVGAEPEDAFVAWIKSDGSVPLFSTYYGGSTGFDEGNSISVSGGGTNVHLAGTTGATNLTVFSTSNGALAPAQQPTNAGSNDAFAAKISVAPLLISPPSATLQPSQGQTFTAIGGAGFGFQFTLLVNSSGATIDVNTGDYVAGSAGGVTDTVQVEDFSGQKAQASVTVGQPTTQLVISPATTAVAPKGTRSFSASGGVPPYQFIFVSNASNGSLTPGGAYTAGTKGNSIDIVRVKDAANNVANATISVSAAITISPPKPATAPKGTIAFQAQGGSNAGFTWSLALAPSGGSIASVSGVYTAGDAAKAVDVVRVIDSLGNTATVNVSIGGALAITPASPATTPRGAIAFEAVGGSGAYTWALAEDLSKGSINQSTGAYVAGNTGNVQDVVTCTDTLGNSASVNIAVGPALTITPNTQSVAATGKISFTAAGGSGVGYLYSIPSNVSGAAIAIDGVYTAGTNGGIDTVRLTDSLGSTADATITVAAAPPPPNNPNTSTSSGGIDAGTIPGINLGGGGNDDCSCRAVGAGSGTTSGSTDASRVLAGLALALGFVWRRRRSSGSK